VPIWVSGTVNKLSMRRLATFGYGWIPWGPDAIDITSGIESMRKAVSAYGRDPDEIQVIGTLPITRNDDGIDLDATMSNVPELVIAGVTDFRAYLPVPDGLDPATEYLTDVVKRFNDCI
ncbi:MAG: LLM class F420-dependent oxidoreductase, partial [Actinomycetota bacterium]|nr:LLM class F420-dependent oxidoreductase [Actinomycetota bacterium]